MKTRNVILTVGLAALVLLASCDTSLSSPRPAAGEVTTVRDGVNSQSGSAIATPTVASGGGVTAGTTDAQTVTITFGGSRIDESTLSAITFRTLTTAAAADGAYGRNATLAPASTTQRYIGEDTRITYTFDLSTAANISDFIELQIDASSLTAAEGTKYLDEDGDDEQGEAAEDDFYNYIAVAGAGITAGGNPRNPQATLSPIGGVQLTGAAVGDAAYTHVWNSDSLSAAILSDAYRLYKYNASTESWDTVSTTIAFDTATSTMTVTLPAAIANGEIYRNALLNPYNVQEADSTNGFRRRRSYDQSLSIEILEEAVPMGTNAEFYTGTTPALFDGGTVINGTVATNWGDFNQSVTFTFDPTVIGNAGIDASTITADSFKLYNSATDEYVPWEDADVTTSDPNQTVFDNNEVTLFLHPGIDTEYDELHIGPSVKFLGDDDAAATDDRFLGDWENVEPVNGAFPYSQFRVIDLSFLIPV